MSRFCFCNCPAGFSAEPERHAPDCPGRSGAGKARTPVSATTPALKVPTTCNWSQDASGLWNSTCGVAWAFMDGSPHSHGMRFCHSCGNTLVVEEQDDV